MAWQREQRLTCPSCGTRPDDWQPDYDPFEAAETVCRGCQLLEEARDAHTGSQAGVRFVLRRDVSDDED